MTVIKQLSSAFVGLGLGFMLGTDASAAQPVAASEAPQAPMLAAAWRRRSADAAVASGTADTSPATRSPGPELTTSQALIMLDYQVIPVPGIESIDLMGFHLLNKVSEGIYLGVGGFAPLVKGEYGGFMVLDATAHVQRKLFGQVFANAGLSAGGGGGGKSVLQSRVLSGTGGFYKAYVGLGYELKDYALGVNVSRMKFSNSAIDHSQLNLFVQVPFSYDIGTYASAGSARSDLGSANTPGGLAHSGENIISLGLDNYSQIKPEGSYKGDINLADLQFSHFMTKNSYWFFEVGVGYRGRPLYNQVLGGLGYRLALSPQLKLYGQLGLGSGGYAPDTINTDAGLLVYPKVSAEYMLDRHWGLLLSGGYMAAPKGSSRNYTFGAALNYHLYSGDAGAGTSGGLYRGVRLSLFQQTESKVSFQNLPRDDIKMLSLQADAVVNEHLYIPLQISVAYNAYLGNPGYGELLTGVGVQTRYDKDSRLQLFGQLLAGTNPHGAIAKYGLGLNYTVSDRLALYAVAGQTLPIDKDKFKSNYIGLGLTYRFSVPGW